MTVARSRFAATLIVGALALAAGEASAAVRVCRPPISSGLVSGASELEGKRRALEAWTLKARLSGGERFANWAVATQKTLRCVPARQAGRFDCIAVATPCTLQQTPGRPEQKRRPGTPGKPIEA